MTKMDKPPPSCPPLPFRLLVMADTHGRLTEARKAILEQGPWDFIVHLGDSLLDAVDLAVELGVDVVGVRGNNEYAHAPGFEEELVFELGGVRFYAVHGHKLDLNPWSQEFEAGLAELARRARRAKAEVGLFAHTHVPLVRELSGVLLVNPGALGHGDKKKTYAQIEVEGPGKVKAWIKEIN